MYTPLIKDIDLSFKKNNLDNDIFYLIDNFSIKAMIINIIFCDNGERFYNYSFGCGLYKYLFDSNDEKNKVIMVENIKSQIEYYIPQIKVENINLIDDMKNSIIINIIYKYKVNDEINQLEIII